MPEDTPLMITGESLFDHTFLINHLARRSASRMVMDHLMSDAHRSGHDVVMFMPTLEVAAGYAPSTPAVNEVEERFQTAYARHMKEAARGMERDALRPIMLTPLEPMEKPSMTRKGRNSIPNRTARQDELAARARRMKAR